MRPPIIDPHWWLIEMGHQLWNPVLQLSGRVDSASVTFSSFCQAFSLLALHAIEPPTLKGMISS